MLLQKKIKEEEEDTEAEITMLSNVNGHISGFPEIDRDEYLDRRINNMLTFKPDLAKISEIEDNKDNIERILALEVADIVHKKSRLKSNEFKNDKDEEETSEESQLNSEIQQKSTQTDPYKSPADTLRRKSIQLVTRIFIKEDGEDAIENKRMDDQNSEGDCKASPLDVFRYPNIRKKFFLLTFEWVAIGIVYNSLSYNTPNLGVDDYLAFFIGKQF